jgi:hypothetical protein
VPRDYDRLAERGIDVKGKIVDRALLAARGAA